MAGEWEPVPGPVVYEVSTGRRVGMGVFFAALAVGMLVTAGVLLSSGHGASGGVGGMVGCGTFLLVGVLGWAYWSFCRSRIEFSGWWVTSTGGTGPTRSFDARTVVRIRQRRNKSSVFYAVWAASASGDVERVTLPTASWGNDGPAARYLLQLVAHGSPGADTDRGTERAMGRLGTGRWT